MIKSKLTPHPRDRGDTAGFGEAASALAGARAAPGESLAQSQVRQLIEWAEARQCLIREDDFEASAAGVERNQ
jgi:hypothetical protein